MSDIDTGIAGLRLGAFVNRIERLSAQRAELAGDLKEVYAEARATGFDARVIKLLVRERAENPDDLAQERALLDLYRQSIKAVA